MIKFPGNYWTKAPKRIQIPVHVPRGSQTLAASLSLVVTVKQVKLVFTKLTVEIF